MARLGISLYPEHSTLDKDKAYVTLAAKYGFKRIFTCLLSVEKEREEILAEFRELIDHAHSYGMEVILDVAPLYLRSCMFLMMICHFSQRCMLTVFVWMKDLIH